MVLYNTIAHLVVDAGEFEHVTPVLRDDLHRLPVPQRIQFKVALTAFNCVWSSGPVYFKDVCIPLADTCNWSNLHLAQRGDMVVPWTGTQLGCQSFHIAAPVVWNAPFLSTSVQHPSVKGNSCMGLKTSLQPAWTSSEKIERVYCTYLLTYLLQSKVGAEQVRKLNERKRGVKKCWSGTRAGRVSGGYWKSYERLSGKWKFPLLRTGVRTRYKNNS